MRLAIIDGSVLTAVLRRMHQAPRGLLGSAFWRFGDELVLSWTTYEEPVPAQVEPDPPGPLMVPGDAMAQLAAGIDLVGEVVIDYDPSRDRLRIGPHALPATPAAPTLPFTLPLDARPRDLLQRVLTEAPEALAAAGYESESEDLSARWSSSLDAAAEALEWTGLTGVDIEAALVEALTQTR